MHYTEQMEDELREAGWKLTPSRRAVLSVFDRHDLHLRADEVLARARKIHPAVGRATVYRTLELLTGMGILHPMVLGDGKTRYARIEDGHHHLVCSSCRQVVEMHDRRFNRLIRRLAHEQGFQMQSNVMECIGTCRECREKETKS